MTALSDASEETERLRHQLRDAQQMLSDAQRLTKTGSWVIDPIGGGASCSPEGYRLLGLPGKTVSAHYMECLAHVHPDDLGAVLTGFQESVATGQPRPLHYRIVAPTGETTDIETIAQPVCDDTGQVVRVVGTVMDVTERNRIRDALRASEQLARGQVGVLTRTLDALVTEASADRLPEAVLRAIAEEFGADSITIWLTDDETHRPAFQFIDNQLLGVADASRVTEPKSLDDQDHILVVPMLIAGDAAGMVAIQLREPRTFRPEEIALAHALANQTMLAIQLTRLSDQSRVAAVIAERNRMARDVHDTLAQSFTGIIVQLEAAADAAARGLWNESEDHRARAAGLARAGLQEARRSVLALRPQALEYHDLSSALQDLVARMTTGTSVVAEFARRGAPYPLPSSWDEHLLRIGQETLTNALRHAAPHRVVMQLTFAPDTVTLEVSDDGRGFNPAASTDGSGLAGVRTRVSSMAGRLSISSSIRSNAAATGTTVTVSLPLPR
jgi:signal transduction histidine kinase